MSIARTKTASVTIRFKQAAAAYGRQSRFSWTCSCKQSIKNFADPGLCRASAQAHSDWHWARGEHSTIELGGLL